jgi:YVTN family beta-propeller protein
MRNRRFLFLILILSFVTSALPVFAQQVIVTVSVGSYPQSSAVNSTTNKIYVANYCGTDPNCASNGTVSVIDGATDNLQSVNVGFYPVVVAVAPVTNKIYVVNNNCINFPRPCAGDGTVTVIDGVTLTTSTVTVGSYPYGVAVNSTTNKIYVTNVCGNDVTCSTDSGTMTVIDGGTLVTTTVLVGANPGAPVANSMTNKIYVPDACGSDPTCTPPTAAGR